MSPTTAHPEDAARIAAAADALLRNAVVADIACETLVAVGCELKDRAIRAWSANPGDVTHLHAAIRALHTRAQHCDEATGRLVAAYEQWVSAIVQLTASDLPRAIACSESAAETFAAASMPAEAANARFAGFVALSMTGQIDEAMRWATSMHAGLLAAGDYIGAAKLTGNLGHLAAENGRSADAIGYFGAAAAAFDALAAPEQAAHARLGLGDELAASGQLDAALDAFSAARAALAGCDQPFAATVALESESLLFLARGEYRESLKRLTDAITAYEALKLPVAVAAATKLLGDAYLTLNLITEAQHTLTEALQQFAALGMATEAAGAHGQLARAALRGGDADDAIDHHLNAADQHYRRTDDQAGLAQTALVRAGLALRRGDAALAKQLAAGAMARFDATGARVAAVHAQLLQARACALIGDTEAAAAATADALDRVSRMPLPALRAQANAARGQALSEQEKWDDAGTCFQQAIDDIEIMWGELPAQSARQALLRDHLAPYTGMIRLALRACAAQPTPANALHLCERVERCRGRTFGQRVDHAASGPELQSRERLAWLYQRYQVALDRGDDQSSLEAEIHAAETALREARLRQAFAATATARQAGAASAVDALQARLAVDDVVVQYGVADDELFACVITRSELRVVRALCSWRAAQAAVRSMRLQMEALPAATQPGSAHHTQRSARANATLQQLGTLLLAPLGAALCGARRLLVIPHAALATVPFAALERGDAANDPSLAVSVAPSLALAVARFDAPTMADVSDRDVLVLADTASLTQAAAEAALLARHWPQASICTGAAASAAMLQQAGSTARLIHLACHGHYRADNAMFSAVQLADGALTAMDIERLRLPDSLVVLGACESAGMDNQGGDEMLGLVRAFFAAGATRVLASHWPVDDAATVIWMDHFYAALRAGQPPSAALRVARSALRQSHPHPCHWAAFTLFGGW